MTCIRIGENSNYSNFDRAFCVLFLLFTSTGNRLFLFSQACTGIHGIEVLFMYLFHPLINAYRYCFDFVG